MNLLRVKIPFGIVTEKKSYLYQSSCLSDFCVQSEWLWLDERCVTLHQNGFHFIENECNRQFMIS